MLYCIAAITLCVSSQNFTCNYSDQAFAQQVVDVAEHERDVQAMQWLGKTLPPWYVKCEINVRLRNHSGGGSTSMDFDRGSVGNWHMLVTGTKGAILNNVIPHEVTHTITASHFKRKVPRWADEGMAALAEDDSVWESHYISLKQTWNTYPIPFHEMMDRQEYGKDMNYVLSFYARSAYAVAYLVKKKGRAGFLAYLNTAHAQGWEAAMQKHYGTSVARAEQEWRGWVAEKPVHHIVEQRRQRLHLYYFYRSDIVCEGCLAVDRAITNGQFNQFKITKIDTATKDGYKLYKDIAAACKAVNPQFVDEGSVPAFHLENRASMKFGFSERRGWGELGTWVTQTVRLPLSMTEAIFSRPKTYGNSHIKPPAPPAEVLNENDIDKKINDSIDAKLSISSTWDEMEERVQPTPANVTPFVAPTPPTEPSVNIKEAVKAAVVNAIKDALKGAPKDDNTEPEKESPTDTPGGIPEMLIGAALLGAKRWAARKRQAA